MILDKRRKRRTRAPSYQTTTIRQFDGGWNVIDNELTLSPKFARILDNLVRGPDGSQSVRFGYGLWKDLKTGDKVNANVSVTLTSTIGNRRLTVNWNAHGKSSGDNVRFTGFSAFNGVPAAEINGIHHVRVITPNSFDIIVTTLPTAASTSAPVLVTAESDDHVVGGNTINGTYFQDRLVIVDETGKITAINSDGVEGIIWDNAAAYALSGNPVGWGRTEFVSFNVFGGKLKVHNGVDKPLEIDFKNTPPVVFLGDPASGGSNAFVPVGRVGFSTSTYAIITAIDSDPSTLQISAQLADGVWTGNPSPADAVDVDMSKASTSFDPTVIGVGELRDRLIVAFRDSISIGTLGGTKVVGSATLHDPQFKDGIPQHGTISHRSIVSLGNDIFMCDRVGVPSISLSQVSGNFIPERVSDFIEPALQANVNRLTNKTLQNKVWALFNVNERQYMLFMPRFDPEDERELDNDPITFLSDLEDDEFVVKHRGHNFEEGDDIVIEGSTDIGGNSAASINGARVVSAIIDADYFTVRTGTAFVEKDITGGGPNVVVRATTDETTGYVFSYNPKLKIRSWARFRDLNFDWGVRSAYGQIFFGKGGKVYRYGNQQYPYSADQVGDYDYLSWDNSFNYVKGNRVYDVVNDTVYIALLDHVSSAAGTFTEEREDNPERWEEYVGNPIKFVWEWPWGDFDKRLRTKQVGAIYPDTSGSGQFDLQLYVDELYKDSGGHRTPVRTISFTGGGAGGYGGGGQPYGGGRRTKEQLLWPIPVICKLAKLRIEGETTDPLRLIAISILYKEGSMKR